MISSAANARASPAIISIPPEGGAEDLFDFRALGQQLVKKAPVLREVRPIDRQIEAGIVTLPTPAARRKPRLRHTPIKAGGRPASELMIAERRGEL